MLKILVFGSSLVSDVERLQLITAGDGPKRIDLEQMKETNMLHDRVELLGAVKHSEVRNVLVQGQIFLNTSLTEAFCIGIVEAACCGLLVVSTKVGGVPEVLPRHMILFGKPEEDDLVSTVNRAINVVKRKEVNSQQFHDEVKEMYSWMNVAERTEIVYNRMMQMDAVPLIERLRRYFGCGVWAGKLFCVIVTLIYFYYVLLEWLFPRSDIDEAFDFDLPAYNAACEHASQAENNSDNLNKVD